MLNRADTMLVRLPNFGLVNQQFNPPVTNQVISRMDLVRRNLLPGLNLEQKNNLLAAAASDGNVSLASRLIDQGADDYGRALEEATFDGQIGIII